MLHIYICPKCFNYRIVSRNPDAVCFHCGAILFRSEIDYTEYIGMSEQDRLKYKEKFINRMMIYKKELETMLTEHK